MNIIVGAGVAGLMAASILDDCLVLEKKASPLNKLLITGNGRCNLTNLKENKLFLENIEYNKKYLYSTINLFGPFEVYNYFKKVGLKEEFDNRVFPKSDKAKDILNHLVSLVKGKINYNEEVLTIEIRGSKKIVKTNKNTYEADNLIIATGGASFKNTGSSGDHIKFLKQLNQPFVNLFPAETGIELEDNYDLAGTSFENVYIPKYKSSGNLIFTHRGMSGESIMKISEYIYLEKVKTLTIDLIPSFDKEKLLKLFDREKFINNNLNLIFSKKFSNHLTKLLNMTDCKLKGVSLDKIYSLLKNYKVNIKKVNDIEIAYVTGGGASLKYIDTKTFESKIHKGVYFIGECLDIHGPIGGYNITLALSTGYSCGYYIKKGE